MSAPAGSCGGCGHPLKWAVDEGPGVLVKCRYCVDLFEGTEVASESTVRGREAVMPDGRPCRSIEEVVQDA